MSSGKLSSAQQARLEFLATLPPRFDRIHRQIEEMATQRDTETVAKGLARSLDSLRNEAQGLVLTSLADNFGMMASLARRGGGLQMRIRGLREGMVGLKTNYEGALRAASRPEGLADPGAEEPSPGTGRTPSSGAADRPPGRP